jgi:predicted permease
MMISAGKVLVFAVGFHILSILIGRMLFFRMPVNTGNVLQFITIFSNCGYMGYPVIGSIYGSQGIFFTSIYVVAFNLFVWTYGVMLFTGKTDWAAVKTALLNPGLIAVVLGMVLFIFSIKLPVPVAQTLQIVGSMTTPISMIVIGSMLAEIRPADLFTGTAIYYGAAVRLIVMPLIALAVLTVLGFKGIILGVCFLAVAMPAAAMSVPLAEKNNGDAIFASRTVFLSTILSVVTIPVMIWLT